eukprot:Rhum_TRINITY_DN14221_c10_g1::Rhum_TRINITY_DN14221_c10_g1_i1::g.74870::m.74870
MGCVFVFSVGALTERRCGVGCRVTLRPQSPCGDGGFARSGATHVVGQQVRLLHAALGVARKAARRRVRCLWLQRQHELLIVPLHNHRQVHLRRQCRDNLAELCERRHVSARNLLHNVADRNAGLQCRALALHHLDAKVVLLAVADTQPVCDFHAKVRKRRRLALAGAHGGCRRLHGLHVHGRHHLHCRDRRRTAPLCHDPAVLLRNQDFVLLVLLDHSLILRRRAQDDCEALRQRTALCLVQGGSDEGRHSLAHAQLLQLLAQDVLCQFTVRAAHVRQHFRDRPVARTVLCKKRIPYFLQRHRLGRDAAVRAVGQRLRLRGRHAARWQRCGLHRR